MEKEKKEIVITGLKVARIAGIIGIVAILVSAIITGIREGSPFALFAENPLILAVIPACLISFFIKDKEKTDDSSRK